MSSSTSIAFALSSLLAALALVTLLIQQVMTKLQERKFAKSERLATVPELPVSANASNASNPKDATLAESSGRL